MPYSDRSASYEHVLIVNDDTDVESFQPEEVCKAAEALIKDLTNNPTPRTTEFLKFFLRDALKHLKEECTTSSEVLLHENQRWIGKKLLVLSNKCIGKGSNGTIVYEGSYEDRPVAVKRLLRSHHELAKKEIKNLIATDHHHNIVRYHGVEWDRDFVYLALEHCHCNLDDLIQIYSAADQYEVVGYDLHCSMSSVTLFRDDRLELLKHILGDFKLYNEKNGRPLPLLLKLMRDMVSGLLHLHELGIVHRDIKPQNILIIKEGATLCAKLSDMGISRKLSEDRSSLSNHSTGCAATGWQAPEQLLHGRRQMRETDLFSLGCVLFFCITGCRHPFGDHDERDGNIMRNKKQNMYMIEDFPEAYHLISALLDADPGKRPKAIEVLNHPLFWDPEKRLRFLHDTGDKVSGNIDLFDALNVTASSVLGTKSKGKGIQTWNQKAARSVWGTTSKGKEIQTCNQKVDDEIIVHASKYVKKGYNFNSVQDLLRLIRNMFSHYEQHPTDIKILLGQSYEGFDDYFTSRFPMMLIEVFKIVREYCKEEESFRKYFKGNL